MKIITSGASKEFLLLLPLSFVFDESCVPGSTLRCAEMVGCVGFTIEAGNHSSPNAMLVALDIIERFIASRATFLCKKTTYVGRALYASGERRTYITLEKILPQDKFEFTVDQVSELFLPQGTVFGRNNSGPVVATRDCYMMMPSKIPNEQDFDAGFLCTRT